MNGGRVEGTLSTSEEKKSQGRDMGLGFIPAMGAKGQVFHSRYHCVSCLCSLSDDTLPRGRCSQPSQEQ